MRLVPVALVAWGVAIAAVLDPAVAWPLAGACAAITLMLFALALLRDRPAVSVLAIACALASVVAGQVALAEPARSAAREERVIDVTRAIVTSKVEPARGGGWRFEVDGDPAARRVPIAVFLTGEKPEFLDLGATVTFTATAAEPFAGQRAAVRALVNDTVTVVAPPPGILMLASELRHTFSLLAARFPGRGAELIPGLSVGDTTIVSAELSEQMTQSSLSHLVAVSGSNCAIITGAAFWLAALLRARRLVRVAVAITVLTGFIVLVTPEPSVIRAGAMSAGAMIALLIGRARSGIPILCLAVSVLLIVDPWLATSIGFALSVCATGALLTLAGPIARRLERIMPAPLALAVAVPLAAQLACAPIIILLDPYVSVVGTLANMVAGPAAPFATVVGLLACLFSGIPALSLVLCALAWAPASWISGVAEVAVTVPLSRMEWTSGVIGALLLAALTAAAVTVWFARRPGVRLIAATAVAVSLAVGIGSAAVRTFIAPQAVPTGWTVAACDVGQGDAMIVRSLQSVAVIDVGIDPDLMSACLDLLQIRHVDLLVLTHFDLDHVGGTSALRGRVGTVLHGPVSSVEDQARLDDLVSHGAIAVHSTVGMTGLLGEARWEVHAPQDRTSPGNDASIVWEVAGGGVPRSIFLGDLSAAAQRLLLSTGRVRGPYDLVKVAHHGSADQEARLYAEISASIALIGVGSNNYGHPRQEILDTLTETSTTTFRTDRGGTIAVMRTHDGWGVWHQRASDDGRDDPSSGGEPVRRPPDNFRETVSARAGRLDV